MDRMFMVCFVVQLIVAITESPRILPKSLSVLEEELIQIYNVIKLPID
jgi:hypothetical protein